jgi:membrane-associated protease RseP (regulator of RpoE activity)
MNSVGVLALAALMAGPFAKPMSAAPEITKSATEVEAQHQLDYVLDTRMAEIGRVDTIAERLLRANVDLCPETRSRLGLTVATADQFKAPYKDPAVRRWGLSDTVRVIRIAPGGAAAAAGLQPGDEVIRLDDQPVASGKRAYEAWSKQVTTTLDAHPAQVRLSVRRNGEPVELTLTPTRECAYDIAMDDESKDLNAFADGKKIVVTRPMVRLASSDSELALVIAHELAHNARKHMRAERRNQAVGMVGGAALDILAAAAGVNTQGAFTKAGAQVGAGMYSPEFEAEADYVGLYFMARADFATDGVENFWRKMAAEEPRGILTRSSHPPTPERYLAIAAARAEIADKVSSAAPLLPNETKTGAQPAAPTTTSATQTASQP